MAFPDPFDEADRPPWRAVAETIEYWAIGSLLVGALGYGIYFGVRSLISAPL